MSERLSLIVQALIGFALMVAYCPAIADNASTPRWIVGAAIALPLFFAPRIDLRAAHWLGLALLAWLLASLSWSEGRLDGLDEAVKLVIVALAFAYGATISEPKWLLTGAIAGIAVSSAIAVLQWYGWTGIESFARPGGLFYNGDRLAEAAALVAVAALALRIRWPLILLAPALLIPGSRTAILALVGVAAFVLWPKTPAILRLCGIVALAAAIALIVHHGGPGVSGRLALWRDTLSGLTWIGHGLGSFRETFPAYATLFQFTTRPEHPHNELLWLAYEGGALGFLLGIGFSVTLWRAVLSPLGAVLVALGIDCLFAMPLHDPATVLFGALIAGHLARVPCRLGGALAARGDALRPGLAAARADGFVPRAF